MWVFRFQTVRTSAAIIAGPCRGQDKANPHTSFPPRSKKEKGRRRPADAGAASLSHAPPITASLFRKAAP